MRRHSRHRASSGFTLIELLLTVVLVLLLLGAVVFNFSSAANGARLDEGTGQMEALFRFARAHAATSGRQVRIEFPEAATGDAAEAVVADAPTTTMRVTWEPDPLGAPGVFQDLPEAADYVQSITDLVSVQQMQTDESGADGEADFAASPPADSAAKSTGQFFPETPHNPVPAVTFYPDGTGDSVEVMLTSRDEEDQRRFSVRVVGLTGSIRRQRVSEANANEPVPPAPATEAAAEAGQ